MDINTVTSIVLLILLVFVGFAYIPFVRLMAMARWALLILWGGIILGVSLWARGGYWDIGPHAAAENWAAIRDALGGQKFSAVFNIAGIAGAVVLLKARQLMIPRESRHGWYWWNAWLHPRRLCRVSIRKKKVGRKGSKT